MHTPSPLLPDPELEEIGDRVIRTLERYVKRLRPTDFRGLIDAPIESVMKGARLAIAADSAGIWIADAGRENLTFAFVNPEESRLLGHEQSLSEGLISLVFASERPICENQIADDERHSKQIDSAIGRTTDAMVAVPFYLGGSLCGILSAVRWKDGPASGTPFSTEDLQLTQRASAVIERLVNLALTKVIFGIEL